MMKIYKDTTKKMQTKEWSYMTVRIPKEVKDKLRKDSKVHLRPIGMHLSYIIIQYFNALGDAGKKGLGGTWRTK